MNRSLPTLRRLVAALAATLVIFPALVTLTAAPAQAAAPEFRYAVGYNGSSMIHAIPGTAVQLDLTGGERAYLYSTGLSATRLTALIAGDNPGTTFRLRCSGPGLSGSAQLGIYYGENMVTPAETTTTGTVRWLLVAPAAGRFTCDLAVASYARNAVIDRVGSIQMRVNAGAALNVTRVGAQHPVKTAVRWALPHQPYADNYVLWSGTTRTSGYTYPVSTGAATVAVVQDVNLTTCIPGDEARFSRCAGAPAYNGSTLDTWIEVQPQRADGTNCGPLIKGTVRRTTISPARHHKTVNDVLHVSKARLGGCPKFRTSLLVSRVSGAPTVIHSAWVAGYAPTHGVGYEY